LTPADIGRHRHSGLDLRKQHPPTPATARPGTTAGTPAGVPRRGWRHRNLPPWPRTGAAVRRPRRRPRSGRRGALPGCRCRASGRRGGGGRRRCAGRGTGARRSPCCSARARPARRSRAPVG
jgi:hypothetical protein